MKQTGSDSSTQPQTLNVPDRKQPHTAATRRRFLGTTAAAAGFAATLALPRNVHASNDQTLKVGLIGSGGRGSGAAVNALNADPHTKITAMADAFADRLENSRKSLTTQLAESHPGRFAVDDDHCFTGFDAYQQLLETDVDVVILATPPHFRPAQLEAAVNAGKHCFVEKPVGVDVKGIERVRAACELAQEKGLSIVSGLCWRYDTAVLETMDRIKNGAIGEIISIESSYNAGTLWHRGNKPEWSPIEYQMRNWLYFTWLSGDHICEQAVHSLDKTAWLLDDTSPTKAMGMGGRQQRTGEQFGNIYDHHAVHYEYPNGVRVFFTCRQQRGCSNFVDETVFGTKGKARILGNRIEGPNAWKFEGKKKSMYDLEHEALFQSIRNGTPINNGHYMCNSSLLAVMGRWATYTGNNITWEQLMASEQLLGPSSYEWGDCACDPVAMPGETQFI